MSTDGERMNTYCVYCEIGQDNKVRTALSQLGYESISFQQVKRYYHGDRYTTRKVPLLPYYVFFDACEEPDWYRIRALPHVQRILEYGDGVRAFQNEDLAFVNWMKQVHGLLVVSEVVQEGTKIRVIGGPLKDYEGKIVEVKKHRKQVAIEIGEDGHFTKIWCPIEYIEQV